MSKKTEICFGNPLFNGTRWRLDAFNLTQDIWRQEVLK